MIRKFLINISLVLLLFSCSNPSSSTEDTEAIEKPIFFTESSEQGLCRMTTDGSEIESLIPWAYHCDISPDKSKIVYHTSDGHLDEATQQWVVEDQEIWLADINGSNKEKITDNSSNDYDPCFSPDGSKIIYVTDRNGNDDIYASDISGSNVVQITSSANDECFPEYSPDGSKITYTHQEGSYSAIMVADADGQNAVDIINDPSESVWTWGSHWSPDGSKLLFTVWNLNGNDKHAIYSVNADGTDITLFYDSVDCRDSSYSPNGEKIVFESKVDDKWQIFSINNDGTNLIQLTDLSNNCYHANWTD